MLMSRVAAVAVLTLMVATAGLTDLGHVSPGKSGGALRLMNDHPDIALRSEVLGFLLGYSGTHIEADFSFENTGAAQDVQMGFPIFTGPQGQLIDIQATVNGKSVPLEELPVTAENMPDLRTRDGYRMPAQWHVLRVTFEEKQTLRVQVSYNQLHLRVHQQYGERPWGSPYVPYYLGTAGSWKGPVDRIEIRAQCVDPQNWSGVGIGFAQMVNGKLIYVLEDYDGDPASLNLVGHPTCGALHVELQPYRVDKGAERLYGFFDGKLLIESELLGEALRARVTKSADGKSITLARVKPLEAADITDVGRLIHKINMRDGYMCGVVEQFTGQRARLSKYEPATPPTPGQTAILVDGLNRLCNSQHLMPYYDAMAKEREPSAALGELKNAKPTGWDLIRFNRMILGEWLPDLLPYRAPVALEPQATVPALPGPEFAEAFPVPEPVRGRGDWVDMRAVVEQLGLHVKLNEGGRAIAIVSVPPPGEPNTR